VSTHAATVGTEVTRDMWPSDPRRWQVMDAAGGDTRSFGGSGKMWVPLIQRAHERKINRQPWA
jgi:hypothetical protein